MFIEIVWEISYPNPTGHHLFEFLANNNHLWSFLIISKIIHLKPFIIFHMWSFIEFKLKVFQILIFDLLRFFFELNFILAFYLRIESKASQKWNKISFEESDFSNGFNDFLGKLFLIQILFNVFVTVIQIKLFVLTILLTFFYLIVIVLNSFHKMLLLLWIKENLEISNEIRVNFLLHWRDLTL